ncbi:hypothetical protein [Streptomyces goshikiensis]
MAEHHVGDVVGAQAQFRERAEDVVVARHHARVEEPVVRIV